MLKRDRIKWNPSLTAIDWENHIDYRAGNPKLSQKERDEAVQNNRRLMGEILEKIGDAHFDGYKEGFKNLKNRIRIEREKERKRCVEQINPNKVPYFWKQVRPEWREPTANILNWAMSQILNGRVSKDGSVIIVNRLRLRR